MSTVTFDKGNRPKILHIFLLRGSAIFLVLFYIYPIVPYAPAFVHNSRYFKAMLETNYISIHPQLLPIFRCVRTS